MVNSQTKTSLKRLKNNEIFRKIIEKVTIHNQLSDDEQQYLLKLSIIFFECFLEEGERYYFEFTYYLLLNYSIITNDYLPLYDFCISNGFYPVSKLIFDKNLIKTNLFDAFYNLGLLRFSNNGRIETKEQQSSLQSLLKSDYKYRSFIAPTSYGKSEFIMNDILNNNLNKIGIIVPKKALIWETFGRMKNLSKSQGYKILMHDTEYDSNDKFIAIFTQERALRLLQESGTCFDILYIDEAHNLYVADVRNILLTRLIRLNAKLNPNQKVVYLSPLISDSKNLLMSKNSPIQEQKISYNIKEPKIVYFSDNEEELVYNRFIDQLFFLEKHNMDWIEYIDNRTNNKSLLYAYKPKSVQDIALAFAAKLPYVDSYEIFEIATNLEKYVDKDYYVVDLLKKGVVFVHGKVPDSIRDYLITKFKLCKDIKFLVSNSSVLEGINFPIDSLFIMNTHNLTKNNLINLIGRVNRLNEIFIESKDVTRLICPVYFVDTIRFGGRNSFRNKISLLRSTDVIDIVKNPILPNSKEKNEKIAKREQIFIDNYDALDIRMILIKNGVDNLYTNFEESIVKIKSNIVNYIEKNITYKIDNSNIFTLVQNIFAIGFTYFDFKEFEVGRITSDKACAFYNQYLTTYFFSDLKRKIKFFLSNFGIYEAKNEHFYIGKEFGELAKKTPLHPDTTRNVYVDLRSKDYKEKVNLAIVKAKIEDDLISYKFASFVKSLYDLKIINEDTYNLFTYNTTSQVKISLLKSGLSHQVIKFIEEYNLFNDIKVVDFGYQVSETFTRMLQIQDDFIKFEIEKIIV